MKSPLPKITKTSILNDDGQGILSPKGAKVVKTKIDKVETTTTASPDVKATKKVVKTYIETGQQKQENKIVKTQIERPTIDEKT